MDDVRYWEPEAAQKRGNVTVTVLDVEEHDDGDWPPTSLSEAVAWLQSKLDSVPPECRDTATLSIDSRTRWDDAEATITIAYTRPETDAEWAARRADVERRMALAAAKKEAAERAEFERLSKKFA